MIYTSVLQQGNKLLVRTRDEKGRGHAESVRDYRPFFFLGGGTESDGYTDVLRIRNLKRKEFDDIKSSREFMTDYVKSSNVSVYGMSNYQYQYIESQFKRDFIADKKTVLKNIIDIEVDSKKGFPKPHLALAQIDAITLYDSFEDRYYVWALYDWTAEASKKAGDLREDLIDKVIFKQCDTEVELLALFMKRWTTNYPDIISGWSSDDFDMLYIYNRLKNLFDEKVANKLSPWGICRLKESTKFGKVEHRLEIIGVAMLDYLRLYKKHTLKMRANYKLGFIAQIELKDGKVSYEEAASLHQLSEVNPRKYVDYNIKDVDIVVRLDQKLNLFDLVIDLAYYAGINYEDTFSPIKIWNGMIYHHLLNKKMVIPYGNFDEDASKDDQFEGAYVKHAPKGLFKWLVSFDLTSLYPKIVQQWNLGIDTIQEDAVPGLESVQFKNIKSQFLAHKIDVMDALRENECCLAMNGTVYSNKNVSFMNELMGMLFEDRSASKKKAQVAKKQMVGMDKSDPEYKKLKQIADSMGTREKAMKVILNSGYGALGNQWFKFFDTRIAEAVTITGQVVTQWVEHDLNLYLNGILSPGQNIDYCLYIDTDSVYLNMEAFVNKFLTPEQIADEALVTGFLDKVAAKINKDVIDTSYERLRAQTNCTEQLMEMKREAIASSGFWKAKKKYALRVLNSEGVSYLDNPDEQLKIMGLEAISSKFPEFATDAMKEATRIILTKDNETLLKYIDGFKEEFFKKPIEDIAAGSGVNGLGEYSDSQGRPKKGCPQHVRAALVYNLALARYDIGMTFPEITEGEKIKFVPLKMPNPLKEPVLGFLQFFPKEFEELNKYIDRDALFQKNFLGPVSGMTGAIGWHHEEVFDLSDFFS